MVDDGGGEAVGSRWDQNRSSAEERGPREEQARRMSKPYNPLRVAVLISGPAGYRSASLGDSAQLGSVGPRATRPLRTSLCGVNCEILAQIRSDHWTNFRNTSAAMVFTSANHIVVALILKERSCNVLSSPIDS